LAIRTQGYWNYFQPVEQTDQGVMGDDTLTLLKNDKIKDFYPALQRQNTKISKQIFPEKEYRGLSPNFHIHVSVSDLYISMIGLPVLLEEICRPILGLYKSLTDT
jgi:hypothetical protein